MANLHSRIFRCYLCHIAVYHNIYKFLERGLCRIPAKFSLSLGGVTPKINYIRRSIEIRRDFYQHIASSLVNTFLIGTLALEVQFNTYALESVVTELTNGVLHTGGNHKVLRFWLLQYEPHALHIILGITPVAE